MKTISRNKRQLIVNGVLAVFTLLVLIVSVVAWFSNRQTAEVDNVNLKVERTEIIVIDDEDVLFPCATKISDVDADQFDSYCAVIRTYTVKGEGSLMVDVDVNVKEDEEDNTGVVAYVLPDHDGQDKMTSGYFNTIFSQLTEEDRASYTNLVKAMNKINDQNGPVGITVDNSDGTKDTEIRVLYWLEYDEVKDALQTDIYKELAFKVKLTFTT